jgi:membrane protein implicated in regulation of membrane protease activity
MIISLFIANVVIQVTIFVVGGTILLLLTKNAIKIILPVNTKTNIDRIIGMKGIVTEKITKRVPGEVKVDGKFWTAVADEEIQKDSTVIILEINSTKLKVKRMEE